MKHTQLLANLIIRFSILVSTLGFTVAHADDYADALQLFRAGKLSEASTKADQFLQTQPKEPQMRFLKGVIQRESGKISESIATFTRLTEDYPELPEPYNNLAVLYASQSQFDKARTALEMAIRTNPSYTTAHENLGDVYAKLASEAYNKALQLDTSSTAVAPKLALIRELFNPTSPKGSRLPTATSNTGNSSVTTVNKAPATTITVPTSASTSNAASNKLPQTETTTPNNKPSIPTATTQADPKVASQLQTKQAELAVVNWAAAWSAKEVKSYLAAYSKEFIPPNGMKRAAWEEERRARINSKSNISVRLSDITTSINGKKATVKFKQDYKADSLIVSSRKSLELVKNGENWQIVKESIGN
jgi:tetratricopeptide (TPR) repeat protein